MIMTRLSVALLCLALILSLTGVSDARVDLSEQAVTYADFEYVNWVTASQQYVFFATTQGLLQYDKIGQNWMPPITLDPAMDRNIRRVWTDQFGREIYVESGTEYYEYDMTLDIWYPIRELPQLMNDTEHLGVPQNFLPPFGFNVTSAGELVDKWGRSFPINDVISDQSGVLWLGTWGYGPAQANSSSRVIELLPFGLLQSRVNAVWEDGDWLWVSGAVFDQFRTGITGFNRSNLTFDYIESGVDRRFPNVDINCLTGNNRYLYAGTPYGLYIIDRSSHRVDRLIDRRHGLPDDNVVSVLQLGDSVFVGTTAGLTVIGANGDSLSRVENSRFSDLIIWDLLEYRGDLWIGTSQGAYKLDLGTGQLQKFKDPTSVLFTDVYAIERNGEDLWMASAEGVVRLNLRTADVTPYRESLVSRDARALAVNDSIVAVNSDNGMTIIYYNRDKDYYREFTTADGLPSTYVFSLLMDGDYIWVGSDDGLTRFLWNNPRRID